MLTKCKNFVHDNALDTIVEFRSEVKHELLPDFYSSLDLFCLPSYFEGFGCVFTEAYACGVPFITCEGQGMDDLVVEEERELWLCKPGDDFELSEKILRFWEKRETQHLKAPIAMNEIMPCYLDYVETKAL